MADHRLARVVWFGLQFDANDIGVPTWAAFSLTQSIGAQQSYIDNCNEVRTWKHLLRTGDQVDIICPMEDFRDYILNTRSMAFPVPTTEVVTRLAEYAAWYEGQNGPAPDFSKMVSNAVRIGRRQEGFSQYQTIRFAKNASDGTLVLRYLDPSPLHAYFCLWTFYFQLPSPALLAS